MNAITEDSPETLRARMVDTIRDAGRARSHVVEAALRSVPRHRFVPAAPVADAYADIAVITKRASDGAALSCASVPTMVATMLDQLDVRSGDRVLEIGAGTGYNAALLAHLVGPSGHVTTVDIDPDVTSQARVALDATGNSHVTVITRDGALGAAEHAPFDRIIFTVGTWDIPSAIWDQLAPSGRIVVPLRWRGQTRSIAFTRDDDMGGLRADSIELCGFVPMLGQDGERSTTIDADGHVILQWDQDQSINPDDLDGLLTRTKATAWSNVTIESAESFDGIWLNLTSAEPGTCRLTVKPAAVHAGLCNPAIPARTPAIVDGPSMAYLAHRRINDGQEPRYELGAIGHGPTGADLAERICEHARTWHLDRGAHPTITAHHLRHAPTDGGYAIDKHDTRIAISG